MADVAGAFRLRAMTVCRIDGAGIHYWVTDAR